LSREFGSIYPTEVFTGLHRFQVIARLAEGGVTREAFQARTLPPIENRVGRREKLIARSREKYAAARVDVEAKIERWLGERDDDPRRIPKGRIPFLPVRM